jgi:hypothetical protein
MKLQILKSIRYQPLAAALAATFMLAQSAHADTESSKLKLAGYIDAAAGEQLIAGNYTAVITKLAPHSEDFAVDQVAASTNLCVAYVAIHQWDAAHGACDEAIKMARRDPSSVSNMDLVERLAHKDALSIANANRAVLSKLSGE